VCFIVYKTTSKLECAILTTPQFVVVENIDNSLQVWHMSGYPPKIIFGSFNTQCLINQIIIHLLVLTKTGFTDMDMGEGGFAD
jgi:hypothetical protein